MPLVAVEPRVNLVELRQFPRQVSFNITLDRITFCFENPDIGRKQNLSGILAAARGQKQVDLLVGDNLRGADAGTPGALGGRIHHKLILPAFRIMDQVIGRAPKGHTDIGFKAVTVNRYG